jgi:cytochrome P450
VVREATEGSEVGGLKLPKGTAVTVVPDCVYMDTKRRRNPTTCVFSPELLNSTTHPISNRFLAIGVGARACIGTRFAMRILKRTLAGLALKLDWTTAPGFAPSDPSGRFPWSEKVPCRVSLAEL